jgi:hypothetical protein
MMGKQDRWEDELFVACTLRELIPADHILQRVDKVPALTRLRAEVKSL